MSEVPSKNRLETLLRSLLDEGLTDAQRQELGELILANEQHRRRYLEYCQMHGLLRAEHGVLAACTDLEEAEAPIQPRPARWRYTRRRLWTAAAAAALLIAAGGIWHLSNRQPAPFRGEPVALLQEQIRAQFAYGPNGEPTPRPGAAMPAGPYELTRGIIELQSFSGVSLTLEAPATFTLLGVDGMRITNGRIAAHVPKSATGYSVEIPNGTVIDLGTDFAIDAVRGEKSEVHVFKGEVQVKLSGAKAIGSTPLHLKTGEATKIDFLTGMPSGIDLDEGRFLRGLEAKPREYTRRVLALQPAAYYPMEPAGDGALLRDACPTRSDARISFGNAKESVWAAGKVGLAFSMGGPAQQTFAVAPDYPKTQGDELSVVAWVMAKSRPRWGSIAKNWAGSDEWGQFHFGLYYDSGELEAHIQDSSGAEVTVKDTVPIPLNAWHHVAFVADGSMLRLYRNGVEVDAAPYHELRGNPLIKALAIGTKLNLAANAPDSHDFNMWDGRLDELAVFNHALTVDQIRELYDLGDAERF
ncbi:MAG TPA: LamG domain-containing protein [Lacipirellula sp.]